MDRASATARREIKPNIGRAFADDDRLGIGETAAVDVDDEIACGEARQRALDAAREFIVRCTRAERFANGEDQQIADAQRRCEREGARAAGSDGMEVERDLHADH